MIFSAAGGQRPFRGPQPARGGGHNRGRASKELVFLIIRIHVLVIAFIMVLWSRSKLKSGGAIIKPPFAAESGASRKAKALVVRPVRQKPGESAPAGRAGEEQPPPPAKALEKPP